MQRSESGNAFIVLLAVLAVLVFIPLTFMAAGMNHPLDRLIRLLFSAIFYGAIAAVFLAVIALFLWVFRVVFADFFQSFGQKIGIDFKALLNEYRVLFMEDFGPLLTKCADIVRVCKKYAGIKNEEFPSPENRDSD